MSQTKAISVFLKNGCDLLLILRGRTGEREVVVYAGLVRDLAIGEDDATSRGGIVMFEVDAVDGYMLQPSVVNAPMDVLALRIVGARGALLRLSDGVLTMTFDVMKNAWRLVALHLIRRGVLSNAAHLRRMRMTLLH